MMTAATTPAFMIMGMVMRVIVWMIVLVVMTAARVIVTATATAVTVGFGAPALPPRQQHEEKSNGQHKHQNDQRLHNK
jgi:hypothetical protein